MDAKHVSRFRREAKWNLAKKKEEKKTPLNSPAIETLVDFPYKPAILVTMQHLTDCRYQGITNLLFNRTNCDKETELLPDDTNDRQCESIVTHFSTFYRFLLFLRFYQRCPKEQGARGQPARSRATTSHL